jgi:coenzyme Q-binding protein COQ10
MPPKVAESGEALFRLAWIFEPQSGPGCKVRLAAEIECRSRFLQRVAGRVLPAAIADIIAAFEARAHQLYGAR